MTSSSPTAFPADSIQRVLFIASTVHIYSIPPLTSNKGYTASVWTSDNNARQIFTARLRIIETATPLLKSQGKEKQEEEVEESLSTEILLEDPSTGELFAKAPYTDAGAVEAVLDSSRFFAIRVAGEGGLKAVLGIGFEERGEAIDFGICLQECRKVLGVETGAEKMKKGKGKVEGVGEVRKDYGLKEGQTIVVDIGRKGRRKAGDDGAVGGDGARGGDDRFFVLPPPAGSEEKAGAGVMPMLAPPPSAQDVRAEKRRSRSFEPVEKTAVELGFDDGEFGEFQ